MAGRFPSHVLPHFNDYTDGLLAYSYLTAHVRFKHAFRQAEDGVTFVDSLGDETEVDAFALWEAWRQQYEPIARQMEILYYRETKTPARRPRMKECAIDLCRYSQPYQVVLAVVEPNESLAHVRHRIQQSRSSGNYETQSRFQEIDILRVPEMFWRIDHRFEELVGRSVANANPAMPIVEAMQTIQFRLDRSGAVVESESRVAIMAIPRLFIFNHPFLVYLQKHGAEHPFFVMWVDNAELLTRR
jgi:hypothetical protein